MHIISLDSRKPPGYESCLLGLQQRKGGGNGRIALNILVGEVVMDLRGGGWEEREMRRIFPWVTALVVCFAMPALGGAAEWEFYGSSRMATFWTETDYGDSLGPSGSKDDADLVFTQQTESRIGANVKAGNVSGRFEYGSAPNLRILWGEWNFGAGKLGVGQNYSPVNIFKSNQVWDDDVGLLYSGGVYGARRDMIRLRFGPVDFALVEVNDADLAGYAGADTDVKIPKLEARYLLSKDAFSFEVGGGYQTYDVVDAADKEESVDAWVVYLGVDYTVGPVLLMGNVYAGQNTGNYDLLELGQNMALWNGTKRGRQRHLRVRRCPRGTSSATC